jgi:hypothetical protein
VQITTLLQEDAEVDGGGGMAARISQSVGPLGSQDIKLFQRYPELKLLGAISHRVGQQPGPLLSIS